MSDSAVLAAVLSKRQQAMQRASSALCPTSPWLSGALCAYEMSIFRGEIRAGLFSLLPGPGESEQGSSAFLLLKHKGSIQWTRSRSTKSYSWIRSAKEAHASAKTISDLRSASWWKVEPERRPLGGASEHPKAQSLLNLGSDPSGLQLGLGAPPFTITRGFWCRLLVLPPFHETLGGACQNSRHF
jgi:hypothetical protein